MVYCYPNSACDLYQRERHIRDRKEKDFDQTFYLVILLKDPKTKLDKDLHFPS